MTEYEFTLSIVMSSVVNYRRKIIKLSKQISKKKDQRLAKEHWKILEKITNLSESVRELRSSMVKTVCVRISTKLHLLPPPHFFMNELTSQRHAAPSMTSTTTGPTPTAAGKTSRSEKREVSLFMDPLHPPPPPPSPPPHTPEDD